MKFGKYHYCFAITLVGILSFTCLFNKKKKKQKRFPTLGNWLHPIVQAPQVETLYVKNIPAFL